MSDVVESTACRDYPARAMIRIFSFAALAGATLAGAALPATPALAQMYPGQGITVNPAVAGTSQVYSGQNGPYPGIVRLHMPVHRHVAAKPKPAASPAPSDVASAPPPPDTTQPAIASAPAEPPAAQSANSAYPPPLDSLTPADSAPPVKKHHHAKAAAAAPPPAQTAPPADSGAGQDSALPLTLDPQGEHPVVPPQTHRQKADAAKAAKMASADTDVAQATTSVIPAKSAPGGKDGLSKRSEILFPRGEPDLSPATVDKMRAVAADLNTLLGAGAQRVQLDAYGGPPGDKSSDSRRLSLKRALGIRQLLIEDGVPSERIDVRAMGGIDDSGAPDRVDVLVRG